MHNLENIILVGDLNLTLDVYEKKGGSIVRDPRREWVEDIILDWDLEYIKPLWGNFTWSNKRLGLGHIAVHLDRFLIQFSFLTFDLLASFKILPNFFSDHNPILLDLSLGKNLGPLPFRFSPLWIHQEGFQEVVSTTWNRQIQCLTFFIWEEKLRGLKKYLKEWAKSFNSPTSKRKYAQEALELHQSIVEDIEITHDLLNKETNLQKELHKYFRVEEEYWRKKSRSL